MTLDGVESCPTQLELSDVLSGRRVDRLEIVARHLETCPQCARLVESLQVESDLERTIRARPPSNVAQPAEMTALIDRVRHIVTSRAGETVDARKLSTTDFAAGSTSPNDASSLVDEALTVLQPSTEPGVLGELAHYRIHQLIGRGGMGIVFQAEDSRLRRQVALKVLTPARAADPHQRERFLREARAAAGIKHDNVVRVYQVDVVTAPRGPTPYLAMEYLEGETLDQALEHGRKFSHDEIRRIGEQIAAGLSAAHASGLIHRDIKPANVFLELPSHPPARSTDSAASLTMPLSSELQLVGDGCGVRVKLLDFGLALPMESIDGRLTQDGYLIGTPAWMSPEQASCMPLDARSDLFSLGSVLYQLATGQLPFTGATTTLQLAALLHTTPVPVQQLSPSLPVPMASLIMQLLERSLNARPASAIEVRDRFRTMDLQSTSKTGRSLSSGLSANGLRLAVALVIVVIVCGILLRSGAKEGTQAINKSSPTAPDAAAPGTVVADANVDTEAQSTSPPQSVAAPPPIDAWLARVEKLTPDMFEAEVRRELCARNPGLEQWLQMRRDSDRIIDLYVGPAFIADLAPLAALKDLNSLRIAYQPAGAKRRLLADISPLNDLRSLQNLELEFCPLIRDLSPLYGKPLVRLSLYETPLVDLTWIGKSRIQNLNIGGRDGPLDLSFLKGSQLIVLEVNESKLRDLSPLQGLPLRHLSCAATEVSDLTPLIGMPLEFLEIRGTLVEDLTPLKSLPTLQKLRCDIRNHQELELVRSLTSVITVNDMPRESVNELSPRARERGNSPMLEKQ